MEHYVLAKDLSLLYFAGKRYRPPPPNLPKAAPGMPSFVWKYATKDSPDEYSCSICGKCFSAKGGGTTSLRRHLHSVHHLTG